MSLIPANYNVYASASDTATFIGSVSAYVNLNYIVINGNSFTVNMYFNKGSTGIIGGFNGAGSGGFANAAGTTIDSFSGVNANNTTYSRTITYSTTILSGYVTCGASGIDNTFTPNPFITASANINFTLNVPVISNMFTVNTTVGYYIHVLPLASSNIGRLFFVKNYGNTNYCAVSTSSSSELIDGFTLNQVRLNNGACIGLTAISATTWSILTYLSNTGSLTTATITGVTPTTITSNTVVADISTVNKYLTLPTPSSWGKGNILMLTAYNQYSATANLFMYVFANGLLANSSSTGSVAMRMQILADLTNYYNHNVSILLLSDGSLWHVAGYFNGSGCIFDNNNNGVPGAGSTTNGIVTHTWGGWVTTHSLPISSGDGRLYFTKMTNVASAAYGIIVENILTPATYGIIGYYPTGWGRVYKNSSGNVNYSGFAMVQANVSGTTLHFPLTMYPSLF
jgi:hypothetical protein